MYNVYCVSNCRIRENLEKKGDPEKLQLFSQLQRALKEGNHISESSLDELLTRPMEHRSRDTNPPLAMFKVERFATIPQMCVSIFLSVNILSTTLD